MFFKYDFLSLLLYFHLIYKHSPLYVNCTFDIIISLLIMLLGSISPVAATIDSSSLLFVVTFVVPQRTSISSVLQSFIGSRARQKAVTCPIFCIGSKGRDIFSSPCSDPFSPLNFSQHPLVFPQYPLIFSQYPLIIFCSIP